MTLHSGLLVRFRGVGASALTTSLQQTMQQILWLKAAEHSVSDAAAADTRVIVTVRASS